MALTQLAPPYPVFTDKNGDPLDNGYLYFGVVDLNPETNPIQVYYDSAFTQPVAQPIRTSNGYPMRNGAPALIFAGSQFSVTVRDKNSDLVIYSPVGYGVDPAAIASVVVSDHTGDGVTTIFGMGASPSSENATNVYIDGVYQNKSTYSISSTLLTFSVAPALSSAIEILSTQTSLIGGTDAGLVTYNQSGTGAVSRTVKAKLQETLSVKDFGAVGDGVTNDAGAFNAANTASGVAAVYVPAGTYLITGTVTGNFFTFGVVTISSGSVNSIIQYNDLSNPPFASIAQGALADTAIQPADTQVSAQGTAVWQLGTGAVESIVSPAKVNAAINQNFIRRHYREYKTTWFVNTNYVFNHDLGELPITVNIVMQAKTTNNGFTEDDFIMPSSGFGYGGYGIFINKITDTDLELRVNSAGVRWANYSTGAAFDITNSTNWSLGCYITA
jgi:hypothetical protein